MKKSRYFHVISVIFLSLILSACQSKETATSESPTETSSSNQTNQDESTVPDYVITEKGSIEGEEGPSHNIVKILYFKAETETLSETELAEICRDVFQKNFEDAKGTHDRMSLLISGTNGTELLDASVEIMEGQTSESFRIYKQYKSDDIVKDELLQ